MRQYAAQVWTGRGWLHWATYRSLWVAASVQRDLEYTRGMVARLAPLSDYAETLRELVPECPNHCPGELESSLHADGLHLRCTECGFFATEVYARHYGASADV